MLCDSISVTLWKRQNHGDGKWLSGCRGQGAERDQQAKYREVLRQQNILCDVTVAGACHYTPIQTQSSYNTQSEPRCELWA